MKADKDLVRFGLKAYIDTSKTVPEIARNLRKNLKSKEYEDDDGFRRVTHLKTLLNKETIA